MDGLKAVPFKPKFSASCEVVTFLKARIFSKLFRAESVLAHPKAKCRSLHFAPHPVTRKARVSGTLARSGRDDKFSNFMA
jgi:hypothetical protein